MYGRTRAKVGEYIPSMRQGLGAWDVTKGEIDANEASQTMQTPGMPRAYGQ